MQNIDVRNAIKTSNLKHWQVADAIGVSEQTLCVWLRHELPEEKKQLIINAIENEKVRI